MVAYDKDDISKADGQRRFGQAARAQNRYAQSDRPSGKIAGDETTDELTRKSKNPIERVRRPVSFL